MTGILQAIAKEPKELPYLLVGGLAVVLHGHPRATFDIDLMIPESSIGPWSAFMKSQGLQEYHRTDAFAQFEGSGSNASVDLMIVEEKTFEKLARSSEEKILDGVEVRVPSAIHLVALKLHALSQEGRKRKDQDWSDVVALIYCCDLDVNEGVFRELIERYGGPDAVREIQRRIAGE